MLDSKSKSKSKSTKAARIGVVITDPYDWTARAFLSNIRKRGAIAVPLNLSALSASISYSDFSVFNVNADAGAGAGSDSKNIDINAIIVRDAGIGLTLEQLSFKFDLLRLFEDSMPVMNTPTAIQNAANKFFSFYLFKRANLPIPRTTITSRLEIAAKAIEEFGCAIVKPIFGSKGEGIIKLKLESSHPQSPPPDPDLNLTSKLAELLKERGVLYLQEFVHNLGRDIRVFVLGGEILGAIYRIPQKGSFLSNLSQGARPVKCELTEGMEELAIGAAKAVGTDFAGVDLIEAEAEGEIRLYLLEVNATPSGKGIKLACGIDVTERIVNHLFERIED